MAWQLQLDSVSQCCTQAVANQILRIRGWFMWNGPSMSSRAAGHSSSSSAPTTSRKGDNYAGCSHSMRHRLRTWGHCLLSIHLAVLVVLACSAYQGQCTGTPGQHSSRACGWQGYVSPATHTISTWLSLPGAHCVMMLNMHTLAITGLCLCVQPHAFGGIMCY